MIRFYNTLTRKIEDFKPIRKGRVGLYTCGPTVYDYAHIGNFRYYIFGDTLKRTLAYFGYLVLHVMNITDVGHLTSDADTGEDKLEKGAAREGKTVWDIARFYTKAFLSDNTRLNILRPDKLIPATKAISQQIALIKKLFENGHAYETPLAVYFDVSTFARYTKLSRQKLEEKKARARVEVVEDPEKKHPQDFALWFKRAGKFKHHAMHWPSPWGDGFPGWHIECSAISSSALGQPFDIHTGGIDHIAVHHTNEIAQSEGAFRKPLARVWMHSEFLSVDGGKMSKSLGNFLTPQALDDKGFNLLSFRYLVLTSHYRSHLNFTWESLEAAEHSLERIYSFIRALLSERKEAKRSVALKTYKKQFYDALADDLRTPQALSALWRIIGDYNKHPESFNAKEVLSLFYDFDQVLGLRFTAVKRDTVPEKIQNIAKERETARLDRNWKKADQLRAKIEAAGFTIFDTPHGPKIQKKQ